MQPSRIWKLIFWAALVTGVIMLVASFDPALTRGVPSALAVSTGHRIEVLISPVGATSNSAPTDLYWLEADGSFKKIRSFEEEIACVTAFQGNLFITFQTDQGSADRGIQGAGGASSIFKDGQWVSTAAAPADFGIFDVAPLGDSVCAVGAVGKGGKIGVRVLEKGAWIEPVQPFDTGRELLIVAVVEIDGGVEAIYASGKRNWYGGADLSKTAWHHVFFDGKAWGKEIAVDPAGDTVIAPATYKGRPAFFTVSADKRLLRLAAAREDGALDEAFQVDLRATGTPHGVSLAALGDAEHLFISAEGAIWDFPVAGGTPGAPKALVKSDMGVGARRQIYMGLFAVGAVIMFSLAVAWAVVRVKGLGKAREG